MNKSTAFCEIIDTFAARFSEYGAVSMASATTELPTSYLFIIFIHTIIMQSLSIEGSIRADIGKKAAKAARGEGQVPCVMYGGEEVVHFTLPKSEVRHMIYTPDFKVAEITLGGKHLRGIIKELQFHPLSDELLHIDFLELSAGKTIKVSVPLVIKGNSVGVRAGGKLLQRIRKVAIKTTVEKLVDALYIDVTELDLGKSLRMRDIPLNDGTTLISAAAIPVVSIEIPRALRSAQAAAAKEAAGPKKKK